MIRLEKRVQKKDHIFDLRNDSIYVSIDQITCKYKSPLDFNKNITFNFYKALKFLINILKAEIDAILEFGPEIIKIDKNDLIIYSNLEKLYELSKVIYKRDSEKLKNITSISEGSKEFLSKIFKNPIEMKKPEKFTMIMNIMLKDLALTFKQILKDPKKRDLIDFSIEKMKNYYPELANILFFNLEVFEQISKEEFNILNYPVQWKKLLRYFDNLKN